MRVYCIGIGTILVDGSQCVGQSIWVMNGISHYRVMSTAVKITRCFTRRISDYDFFSSLILIRGYNKGEEYYEDLKKFAGKLFDVNRVGAVLNLEYTKRYITCTSHGTSRAHGYV